MKILFTKMHGIGNDYIFIDMIKNKYPLLLEDKIPKLARFLCKEHFGVGSDGVILIDSSRKADFKMRIFNKDGKEVYRSPQYKIKNKNSHEADEYGY